MVLKNSTSGSGPDGASRLASSNGILLVSADYSVDSTMDLEPGAREIYAIDWSGIT